MYSEQMKSGRKKNLFIIDEKKFIKQFAASNDVLFECPFKIKLGIICDFLFGLMKELILFHNFFEETDCDSITLL